MSQIIHKVSNNPWKHEARSEAGGRLFLFGKFDYWQGDTQRTPGDHGLSGPGGTTRICPDAFTDVALSRSRPPAGEKLSDEEVTGLRSIVAPRSVI